MEEQAKRFNQGKTRYDLLPEYAIQQLANVMTFGAQKYGDDNWKKGLKWSNCLASLKRHIAKFEKGIDYDEETGYSHIAHAMTNCAFILEYYKLHPELDDRKQPYLNIPKIGLDIDDVIADFCGGFTEKYGFNTPKFWNFSYKTREILNNKEEIEQFYLDLKPKINPDDMLFEPTCYITSRPIQTQITQQWIENNGFPCVPIYTVDMNHSKVEVAKKAGIDCFVDDKFDNFVELNNAGINTYLLTMPHNEKYNVGHKRIDNINDLITRYNTF